MKHVKAIFKKQFKDTLKNPGVLIQFLIFPLVAWVMDFVMVTDIHLEGVPEDVAAMILDSMPNVPNMMVMQAGIFAGMGLITAICGMISEDMDKKSLRFLSMAGVKPISYLAGVGGVVLLFSFFTSVAFAFIGGFSGLDFWLFTGAMLSVAVGSIVLGATFGILAGNQQAASGMVLPVAIILGFGPMMAQFNDNIARFMRFVYTQQLNIVADHLTLGNIDTPLWQAYAVIWGNILALGLLFSFVFKKKWAA